MWSGELAVSIRVAVVVVPVGVYFLILGLLNTRKHPQALSGRLDFALLISALCPLVVIPLLHYVGLTAVSLAVAVAAVACGIVLLAPRGHAWVVYNISTRQVRRAVTDALAAAGAKWHVDRGAFHLNSGQARIDIVVFPLLRNVSVRYRGPDDLARRFAAQLSGVLATVPAETSPTASALLLVATAMLMAPLALMVNQAGQIVRILTGLMN